VKKESAMRFYKLPLHFRWAAILVAAPVGLVPLCIPSFAQEPSQPTLQSAKVFVEGYVALYQKEDSPAKLAEKLTAAWDLSRVVRETFAPDLAPGDVKRQKILQEKITRLFEVVLANEQIAKLMKRVKASDFCCVMVNEKQAAVSFAASVGDKSINNMLVLQHGEKGWRIIELANSTPGSDRGFIQTMRAGYEKVRGQMSPEQLLDEVLKAVAQGAEK
jgi:hypothetical protein